MRNSYVNITFITGAGFHTAMSEDFSASGWEWKAAKEAIEDGYEKKVREHIHKSLGSLGSFSIKRYFSEARSRVFDAKFVPNGVDVVSLAEHRKGIARDIEKWVKENRCLYGSLKIECKKEEKSYLLTGKSIRWFKDVVLWFLSIINGDMDEEQTEGLISRAKEICRCVIDKNNEESICEKEDSIELFSETVSVVNDFIVFVLQNTLPKDNVDDVPVVTDSFDEKHKPHIPKHIYVYLANLVMVFYALLGLMNILGVDRQMNERVRKIIAKLPINIRMQININEIISDVLDSDNLSKILFDSKILEILSTKYPFLEIRERLSEWYAGFFGGDLSSAKKYVYISKILMHYLRKKFSEAEKEEKTEDAKIENSQIKQFIEFMQKHAYAVITTNYVPIESKILFDDFRKWSEDGKGRCGKRVIYVHGHLEEEIVVGMYTQGIGKGKMVDFRFEAFYSSLEEEERGEGIPNDLREYIEKEIQGEAGESKKYNIRMAISSERGSKNISLFTLPASIPPLAYKTFPNGFFARRFQVAVETLLNSRRIVVGFGMNPEDHFFSDVLDLYLYRAYKKTEDKRVIVRENQQMNR